MTTNELTKIWAKISVLFARKTEVATKADKAALRDFCPIIEDTRSSAVGNITGVAPFSSLVNGQMVVIHFNRVTYASSTLTLTLSDGTTTAAIPMKASYHNAGNYDINGDLRCNSGSYHLFVYDSTNNVWHTVGDIDYFNVYNGITKAILDTGTSTVNCLISAKLLRDNFYIKDEAQAKRRVVDNSQDASVVLAADTYNQLGSTDAPVVSLPASYTAADEFLYSFTCASDACVVTLPQGVVLSDGFDFSEIAAGVVYQVSIMDDVAAYLVLTPNA